MWLITKTNNNKTTTKDKNKKNMNRQPTKDRRFRFLLTTSQRDPQTSKRLLSYSHYVGVTPLTRSPQVLRHPPTLIVIPATVFLDERHPSLSPKTSRSVMQFSDERRRASPHDLGCHVTLIHWGVWKELTMIGESDWELNDRPFRIELSSH